jgi:hypothetical protein
MSAASLVSDRTAQQVLSSMLKFGINLKDPNLCQDLLSRLPGLQDTIKSEEKRIDQEFINLKLEQEIAHMHDNEEVTGFVSSYKQIKGSLAKIKEAVELESLGFAEIIDKFQANREHREESEFIRNVVEILEQLKLGKYNPPNVGDLTLPELLSLLERIEFLKEVLKKNSNAESTDVRIAAQKVSDYSSAWKGEVTQRLSRLLATKGLAEDKDESYKSIGLIYNFFDKIKEKKKAEEQIFTYLVGPRQEKEIVSREDIENEFLKNLMLMKRQIKQMGANEGIFVKIFGDKAGIVFENFCKFVGNKYIGEYASNTLQKCLGQHKIAYFLELLDMFNEAFYKFKSSVSKWSNTNLFMQDLETTYIKYMSAHNSTYFDKEKKNFEECIMRMYNALKSEIDRFKPKINEISPTVLNDTLKIFLSREKIIEIISLYKTTLGRVKRNTPSYTINEKSNVIVNTFFDVVFKYFKESIDIIKTKILSTDEVNFKDLNIYSLLGKASQDLDLVGVSKVDVCTLFNTFFYIKELENKYKVFDNEMKNELNNCISLLLERLFESLSDIVAQKPKTKPSKSDSMIASKVCLETVEGLEKLRNQLFNSFTENTRKKIYSNIGTRLVSHLKKVIPTKAYYTNYSSSLQSDMDKYYEFLKTLDNQQVLESFEVLKKLVKILSTPANMIETYLETMKLNTLENKQIIQAFVSCAALSNN